jgi:RNA polymerase sigma-70 factor (ECF subfamily)
MTRTQEDIQDELLVLQCQSGDGDALKALIVRWQPKLVGLAWRLTAQREAAQDIVQDSWMAIVRGLKRLDDPARFRTWAYRIVKNKCMDWMRRRAVERKASKELQDAALLQSAETEGDSQSDRDIRLLRHAMSQLPQEQRAMLSLHYLDGMSVKEIGRVLDVPAGTVKSRLYHARNRLKQELERVET